MSGTHSHHTDAQQDGWIDTPVKGVGRPYTLVLEKTSAQFERDAVERREWKKDLAWLRKTGGCFTRARE